MKKVWYQLYGIEGIDLRKASISYILYIIHIIRRSTTYYVVLERVVRGVRRTAVPEYRTIVTLFQSGLLKRIF